MNKLNFAFFGTPDVASETLEILKQAGYVPSLIITSPDAKKGRGLHLQASPVANFAKENDIPCLKPKKLDETFDLVVGAPSSALAAQWDFFVITAYGKIIPEKIINRPKYGSVNIHYSLLPKYRGTSPVESAILNGDAETGVTIQQVAFKMDSGPILAQEKILILPDEKAPDLRKRLIKIGAELLIKTLPKLTAEKIKPIPQNEQEATYCPKIKKTDGWINLEKEPAGALYNKFRAYAFWPRIFFFQDGKRIIITEAKLADNQFIIKKVLPEGKKETNWKDFKAKQALF